MKPRHLLVGLALALCACSSGAGSPSPSSVDVADADVALPEVLDAPPDVPAPDADAAGSDSDATSDSPDASPDAPESWPEYPQFVRSEHGCQGLQSFAGPPPLTARQREINAQRPPPSVPYGAPIDEAKLPTVHCDLAEGCPTLARSFQMSVPDSSDRRIVDDAIRTASGRIVTGRGLTMFTWEGSFEWEIDRVGLIFVTGIAGTDDVLAWYQQAGGPGYPPWVYHGLARINGHGDFVWSQPSLVMSKVAVFPEHDLAVISFNPNDCPYNSDETVNACHPGLLVLRLSDGAFVRCVEGHFAGASAEGLNRNYAITTTRDQMFVAGDLAFKWYDVVTGSAGRVPYSTGLTVPVNYNFGGSAYLDNATPIILADGTVFGRSGSGYVHWSKEAGMLQEWLWIADPTDPSPVQFPGTPTLHYDGSIYQSIGGGLMRLPDSPTWFGPDGPWWEYINNNVRPYSAPFILKDGTVLVFSFLDVVAFAPGGLQRIWTIHHNDNVERVMIFGDDDTFMLLNVLGQVTWWNHVHGGLAHTPAPMQAMNNRNDGRAPSPPFSDHAEIEPRWRRAE